PGALGVPVPTRTAVAPVVCGLLQRRGGLQPGHAPGRNPGAGGALGDPRLRRVAAGTPTGTSWAVPACRPPRAASAPAQSLLPARHGRVPWADAHRPGIAPTGAFSAAQSGAGLARRAWPLRCDLLAQCLDLLRGDDQGVDVKPGLRPPPTGGAASGRVG